MFAGFFSFISVSSSVFFLDGDIANVGNWALRDLYFSDFKNDPIIAKDSAYYLKPHMFMVEAFMKLTGSYTMALKLLMFLQISLTMVTTYYMICGLFSNIKNYWAAAASLFITMVYIKVPVFECNGFVDLRCASARSTFCIFIPLILLYYFRGHDIRVKNFNIPRIFVIAAATAVLAQFHPQTGITVMATLFIHWLIIKRNTFTVRKLLLFAAGMIPFAVGIYFFLDSFSRVTFKTEAFSFALSRLTELFTSKQYFCESFFNLNSFWLLQFTFLPYIFIALIMIFFIKALPEDADDRKLFVFLRAFFFIALSMHLILGFAGYNFLTLASMGMDSIFMRSTKFVLFLAELLALFYVLKGRCFVKSPWLHGVSSFAIVFCLFSMSSSRLDLQHETLARIFAYVPCIDDTNDIKYNVIFKLPIIGLLIFILLMAVLTRKPELWKRILVIYCIALLFLMPFASKAVKMKMGEICDSTAGLGSWYLLEKLNPASTCASELSSFEDSAKWIKTNTPRGTMVFTMMRPSDGQRFKIAAMRPGLGDPNDGCITGGGDEFMKEIDEFYKKLEGAQGETIFTVLDEKLKKYDCKVIVVYKDIFPGTVSVLNGKLKLAHSNKCYNIYYSSKKDQDGPVMEK